MTEPIEERDRRDVITSGYFLCCSTLRAYLRGDNEWFATHRLAVSMTQTEVANVSLNNLRALVMVNDPDISQRAERALYDMTEQVSSTRRERASAEISTANRLIQQCKDECAVASYAQYEVASSGLRGFAGVGPVFTAKDFGA